MHNDGNDDNDYDNRGDDCKEDNDDYGKDAAVAANDNDDDDNDDGGGGGGDDDVMMMMVMMMIMMMITIMRMLLMMVMVMMMVMMMMMMISPFNISFIHSNFFQCFPLSSCLFSSPSFTFSLFRPCSNTLSLSATLLFLRLTPPVFLSLSFFLSPINCLYLCLSGCLSDFVSLSLSACLHVSVCLSVCPSLSISPPLPAPCSDYSQAHRVSVSWLCFEQVRSSVLFP